MQRARLNRLITSVISMDLLIRYGIQDVGMSKFDLYATLLEAGKRVLIVLDMSNDDTQGERDETARLLLVENLGTIRQIRKNLVLPAFDNGPFMEQIESRLKQEGPVSTEFSSQENTLRFFFEAC